MAEAPKPAEHAAFKPSGYVTPPAEHAPAKAEPHVVVAPTVAPKAPVVSKAEEKPSHTHYEVLVDTWGYDTEYGPAPVKGDVIAAADIGPHHKWAVANGVVKGITAKQAAAKAKDDDEE